MTFSSNIRLRLTLLLLGTSLFVGFGVWLLLKETLEEGIRIEGRTILQSIAGVSAWNQRERGGILTGFDPCSLVGKGTLLDLEIESLSNGEPLFSSRSCSTSPPIPPGENLRLNHTESIPGIGDVRFSVLLSDAELDGLGLEVARFMSFAVAGLLGLGWLLTSLFARALRADLLGFGGPPRTGHNPSRLREIMDLRLLDSIVKASLERPSRLLPAIRDSLEVPLASGRTAQVRRIILEETEPNSCVLVETLADRIRLHPLPADPIRFPFALEAALTPGSIGSSCPIPSPEDHPSCLLSDGSRVLLRAIPSGDHHV
ncbi:MAG: hypothetical protein H6686_11955 [Fibrobacteria bacterium]|nr:hypothetical protein [Fibrobacteria bacterium]